MGAKTIGNIKTEYKNCGAVMTSARRVADGSKVACVELKQACQRFLRDLEDPRWVFRYDDAEFIINIIETTFVHIKGPLTGQSFLLANLGSGLLYSLAANILSCNTENRVYSVD